MRFIISSLLAIFYSLSSSAMETTHIRLNDETLIVELAKTETERTIGLMGRSKLPEGCGMLFIFEKPQVLAFWMKNTRIALDIGFFDENRRLVHVEHMDPPIRGFLQEYRSFKSALYALEVPQGWFKRHHVELSTRIEWDAPQ